MMKNCNKKCAILTKDNSKLIDTCVNDKENKKSFEMDEQTSCQIMPSHIHIPDSITPQSTSPQDNNLNMLTINNKDNKDDTMNGPLHSPVRLSRPPPPPPIEATMDNDDCEENTPLIHSPFNTAHVNANSKNDNDDNNDNKSDDNNNKKSNYNFDEMEANEQHEGQISYDDNSGNNNYSNAHKTSKHIIRQNNNRYRRISSSAHTINENLKELKPSQQEEDDSYI